MTTAIALEESALRPRLVAELEEFRASGQLLSNYYLNLKPPSGAGSPLQVGKRALALARELLDRVEATPEVRHALRRDREAVDDLVGAIAGEEHTLGLACFVASEAGFGRTVRFPFLIRNRVFFEQRFVVWPLRQALDQADRYAVILTDKSHARLFRYHLAQIEEVADVFDAIPGRIAFPDPFGEAHYMHKHVEHVHHHFDKVAEAALRHFEYRPFEHLIIGGRSETLPQFEGCLHRYLRDRIVARWEIDVRVSVSEIQGRTLKVEQEVLKRQAREIWQTIQDFRPYRGALGPDEVFTALWQRRVQSLLADPDVRKPGFRCTVCGRLHLNSGPCVECGGQTTDLEDIYEDAVHDAVEQDAHVRYWKDPVLSKAGSIAALKRY